MCLSFSLSSDEGPILPGGQGRGDREWGLRTVLGRLESGHLNVVQMDLHLAGHFFKFSFLAKDKIISLCDKKRLLFIHLQSLLLLLLC